MRSNIFKNNVPTPLKNEIYLDIDQNTKVISGDTDDPTSVAKDAPQGSIYFRLGTNEMYKKDDNGSSTNWIPFNIEKTNQTVFQVEEGMALDNYDITIVDDTGLKFEVEKTGGGDVRFILGGVVCTLDCTTGSGTGGKARAALTEGTATVPQVNHIYVTAVGTTLTLNANSAHPTGSFGWIAECAVPDATTWGTTGAYSLQRYSEALIKTSQRGALSHEREKLRAQGATYSEGIGQTLTITTNVGTPDNVVFTSATGWVYQLHRQQFPAFSGTPTIYIANDSSTPFKTVTDLNSELTDADGNSLSGTYYNLVIWGAMSSNSKSKLFCNLPSGSYNNADDALLDVSNTANYAIPEAFSGTGFLIARLALRHQVTSGGTWTNLSGGTAVIDLRGQKGTLGGGAGGGSTDHGNLSGLTDDDHTQYALLAGRASEVYKVPTIQAYDAAGLAIKDSAGTTQASLTSAGLQIGTTGARVTEILDEDTMASDSPVKICTQQSIKAYVDGKNDKVIALYKSSSGDAIPSSTTGDTIYQFDTLGIDTHSAVTTGSGWNFEAPVADKYRVVVILTSSATAAAAGRVFNSIYVDTGGGAAAVYITETSFGTDTRVGNCFIETIINMAAGDKLDYRNRNTQTSATLSVSTDARQNYILIESLNDV